MTCCATTQIPDQHCRITGNAGHPATAGGLHRDSRASCKRTDTGRKSPIGTDSLRCSACDMHGERRSIDSVAADRRAAKFAGRRIAGRKAKQQDEREGFAKHVVSMPDHS